MFVLIPGISPEIDSSINFFGFLEIFFCFGFLFKFIFIEPVLFIFGLLILISGIFGFCPFKLKFGKLIFISGISILFFREESMISVLGVNICFFGFKLIILSLISFPNSSFKVITGLNSLFILLFVIFNPDISPLIFILESIIGFGIFILNPGIFPFILIFESTLGFEASILISGIFPFISTFGKLNSGFDILIFTDGNLKLLFDIKSSLFPHSVGFIIFKYIFSFISSWHICFNVNEENSFLSLFNLGLFNLTFISGFWIFKFPLRFGLFISKLGMLKSNSLVFKFVSIFGLLISAFKFKFGLFNLGPLMSRLALGNFNSRFPFIPFINPGILKLSVPHNSCFITFKLILSSISPLNICFKVIQFFSSLFALIKFILNSGFFILVFNSGILIFVSIWGSFIFIPSIFPFMLKSGILISFIGLFDILISGLLILIFPLGIFKSRFPLIIPDIEKLFSLILFPHNFGFLIFNIILSSISQLNNSFNVILSILLSFLLFSLISNFIPLRLTSIFGFLIFVFICGLTIPILAFGIFKFISGISFSIFISVSKSGIL